jgi:hypothetical protein
MDRMNLRRIASGCVAALVLAVAPVASAAPPQLNVDINRHLQRLEGELHLTPEQKAQYDAAVAASKRMLFQLTMAGVQAKARIEAELKKPRPDLNVLWELRDLIVEDGKTLRKEAREEWGKLYAMLNDDQVKILKQFIEERVEHLGLLHDFFLQLILTPPGERI